MELLKRAFNNVWLILAVCFLGALLATQWRLGVLERSLSDAQDEVQKYRSQVEVATTFNTSLNATVDRLSSEMAANNQAVIEMNGLERQASQQLQSDLALIMKGFENAQDDCWDKRPPDDVVSRMRAIYARGDNED